MKATGIVRRIDELGRVVIPKEIRRTLRIREGDPLEIFTDRDGEIILKKYSPIGELSDFAREYTASISQAMNMVACIVDKDVVVAVAGVGGKKELMDRPISAELEKIMESRKPFLASAAFGERMIPIASGEEDRNAYTGQVAVPIIAEGEVIGAVVLLTKDLDRQMGEVEQKVAQTAASFVGKQMEG